MQRIFLLTVLLVLEMSSCMPAIVPVESDPARPQPSDAPRPVSTPTTVSFPSATSSVTETPSPTPWPTYPPEGYGPKNFPPDVNPLTGLKVADPALLERRPMVIKVENLPREHRPQWGLSFADHVFEYYTEEGSTRYAAVYYGRDAEMVAPIRSARLFDIHLVRMYKAIFAFGSADARVFSQLANSEFEKLLVVEAFCPPMCRYEPRGINVLYTKTSELGKFVEQKNVQDDRQNLDGLSFNLNTPSGGTPVSQIFVRYSAAIYNRWDYDPVMGKYYRFSDSANDFGGDNEQYTQLTDRLNNQPITADNVVVIFVTHQYFSQKPEIIDIVFSGPYKAFVFRDGQAYPVTWNRFALDTIVSLWTAEDKNFPLKPGNVWFEILGHSSKLEKNNNNWRFTFNIP